MMNTHYRFLIAACIFVACSVSAHVAFPDTPAFGSVSEEEWAESPPENYPEARAMVLFDEGFYELEWRKIFFNRHVRIKIFRKDEVNDIAYVEIPLHEGDEIRELNAHTILPDGHTVGVEDFFNKTVNKVKVRAFTFPAVEDGCIVEYRFRIRCKKYGPRRWDFQNNIYTKRSTYSVKGGGAEPITNNLPMFTEATYEEIDGDSLYTLELTDLMPVKDEPLMGARLDHMIWVDHWGASVAGQYSRYGWNDLGEWVEEWMASDLHDSRKEMRKCADSLCEGLQDEIETIDRVYEYVSNEIVTDDNLEDAENLKDIMRDGRGTTYEKNLLCVELLRSRDIPARPLFISTRDQSGKINARIRSLSQFNRLLCCIDYDTTMYLLDPAAACATFLHPDRDDLAEQGFLIDGEDSRILNLSHRPRNNGTDIFSTVHIDEEGSAICSAAVICRGYAMDRWCREDFDSLTIEEMIGDMLEDREIDFEIIEIGHTLDSEKDRLIIEMVLHMTEFALTVDDNLFIPMCVLPVEKNRFESDHRMFPVDFTYTFSDKHQTQIYLPEGMQVGDLPRNAYKQIQGGVYKRQTAADGNQILVKAELNISRPLFPVPQYASLKELFEVMDESSQDNAVAVRAEKTDGDM